MVTNLLSWEWSPSKICRPLSFGGSLIILQNFQPPYSLFLQANSCLTGYAGNGFSLYRTSISFALMNIGSLQVILNNVWEYWLLFRGLVSTKTSSRSSKSLWSSEACPKQKTPNPFISPQAGCAVKWSISSSFKIIWFSNGPLRIQCW